MVSATRDRLDRLHRERQAALLDAVQASLLGLIVALPDVDEAHAARYVREATKVVVAGQRRSVTYAVAYLLAAAGDRPESVSTGAALGDVAVTRGTAWVASPILRARAKLAKGAGMEEALAVAGEYAGALASGDLQAAQRAGLDHAATLTSQKVIGYRKLLAGNACKWCRKVAGEGQARPRLYHSAEGLPFHKHDRCSVAPIFRD